jgi:seryl-tRNA synthetase
MLDIKRLANDPEGSEAALKRRDSNASFAPILALNEERRGTVSRFNDLRHEQKTCSQGFKNKDMSPDDRAELHAKLKVLSDEVKAAEARTKELDQQLKDALLHVPNLPDPAAPVGRCDADNAVVRTWGEPASYAFEPRPHEVLGEALGILDFEAARKISGARFALYRGLGARLERSLASFMLDLHTREHGYEEILPPFLVLRDAMIGTGQLPKFEEDAFKTAEDDLFLIPTSEVPVTNIHREEILDGADLPRCYVAFSSCFRREAGSYGKDTHGLTRLHQFQKVELVQITTQEASADAHERLTGQAEAVLQALGLPYRVVDLCTGDLGFCAQRCYDLEVWLPGQKSWREISSCSNFGDFQARRAGIRYRPAPGDKPRYAHTLNGSGLAIGRTVMALLEHYQQADGSIAIPDVLQPYMGTDRIG